MKAFSFFLFVALAASRAHADVVYLTDGTRLEGKVQRVGDGWIITDITGHQTAVQPQQLASMEPSAPTTRSAASADAVARDRLADLHLAVAEMSDPKQAVEAYKTYLAKYGASASADTARAEMAMWQDRVDRGLVRYGARWVSAADLAGLQHDDFSRVSQAGSLLGDGRLKECLAALAPILTENPHNAPALYLQGISYFDLEQLANSRKSLEAANAVAPRNGPVLNNLAVVLYRQKQFPSALGYYDQALLAMPANTQILDNVIEAMNSLPDADRQAVIAQRLAKLAADQDATAQKTMAAKGLHRWGSTWIDQSQSDQIQAAQQTIGQQVSNLQTQISALDQQLVSMRTTVDQNTILMQQIQASSIARDPNTGNVIFLAYPPEYYTMLNTNSNLYGAIQSGQSREANLNQEITKVQQQPLPVPKFTGVQHMMGPDELTTFLPPGTATQPAANTPAIKGDSSLSPEPQTPAAPSPAPKPPGPGDVPIPAPALPGHFVPPDLPSSMVFPTVPAFSSAAAG